MAPREVGSTIHQSLGAGPRLYEVCEVRQGGEGVLGRAVQVDSIKTRVVSAYGFSV